jgi:predicted lipid-binding transport protein (Tim44 family)
MLVREADRLVRGMGEIFDLSNILILAIAVAIFLRLRSVLGRRTGTERRPFDPYAARERSEPAAEPSHDNVVALPRSGKGEAGQTAAENVEERLAKAAEEGTPLYDQLKQLMEADPSFDPKDFLEGANMAYEMIVTAFANGDRRTLRPLLADEVFEGFDAAIASRDERGEKVSSTLIGIDKAKIVDAAVKGPNEQVTVRFQSQLITATYDADATLIEGDPNKVMDVVDVWTFARDIHSDDPNWKLVATESA